MEPVNINMPGYGINEYMLVISPPEDLWQKITRVKEEFAEQYKAPVAKFTKPHIALVNFLTWSMMEEKILQRLQTIAMGMVPFKIELKDYGSYPSHTIIINVTSKLPIKNLVSELKTAQRIMKLNQENKAHFLDEPHITIAHKLKPWQYEQGWEAFSHRHFTGRFIADSMLLLKRRSGEKAFQIVKRFDFMNLPVSTKQGSLFV
jgi:2'-5' RNA ligase